MSAYLFRVSLCNATGPVLQRLFVRITARAGFFAMVFGTAAPIPINGEVNCSFIMKKFGIIGGLAWPSTVEYYRLLCSKTNKHFQRQAVDAPYPTPPMVIESLNMNMTRQLRGKKGDESSWAAYDEVFRAAFLRLKDAGAEFGLIASNSPHMRWDGIQRGLDFPLLSILETTAGIVQTLAGTAAFILGTSMTMRSPVYTQTLNRHGINVLATPSDDEIAAMDRLIDIDLYQNDAGKAKEFILGLCRRNVAEPDTAIVCLACTELPLAFPEYRESASFESDGFRFVNTTVAHIDATLRKALA